MAETLSGHVMANIPLTDIFAHAAELAATKAAQGAVNTQGGQNTPLQLSSSGGNINVPSMREQLGVPANIPLTSASSHFPTPQIGSSVPKPQFSADNREFQTASGNRRAAFNNAMSGISQSIQYATNKMEEKKNRATAQDIERLMTAQQGMQQAQPGSEDFKHNQQIVQDILGDPKKVKTIQKALNINLLGDKKEMAPLLMAYQGWMRGGKQGENPMGKQASANLEKAMPRTQGINPQIMAALQIAEQMKKSGMITQQDAFNKSVEILKTRMTGDAARDRTIINNTGRLMATQMVTDAHKYASQLGYYGKIDAETQRGLNQIQDVLTKAQTAASKPNEKSLNEFEKTIDTSLKEVQGRIKAKTDEVTKLDGAWFKSEQQKKDLAKAKLDLEFYQKQARQFETWKTVWVVNARKAILGIGESNEQPQSNPGASTTDGSSTGSGSSSDPQAGAGAAGATTVNSPTGATGTGQPNQQSYPIGHALRSLISWWDDAVGDGPEAK